MSEPEFTLREINETFSLMIAGLLEGYEKNKLFMDDFQIQLTAREEVRTAMSNVLANPMTMGPDFPSLDKPMHMLHQLQLELDKWSNYDWLRGNCYFSELNSSLIEQYLNMATYILPHYDRDASRDRIIAYLDAGRLHQERFFSTMKKLDSIDIDRNEAIREFENVFRIS